MTTHTEGEMETRWRQTKKRGEQPWKKVVILCFAFFIGTLEIISNQGKTMTASKCLWVIRKYYRTMLGSSGSVFEIREGPMGGSKRHKDMIKKQSSHDSVRNCLSSNGSGGGDVVNLHSIASNPISGDEESSSNCRDSSLIDLKLGRFGDTLPYNAAIRVGAPVVSCADSSTSPSKRVKSSTLRLQFVRFHVD